MASRRMFIGKQFGVLFRLRILKTTGGAIVMLLSVLGRL
jgi:hypothetical protein